MLEVRWSPPPLALLVIGSSLLGSYNEYGDISTPTSHKPYMFIQTLFTLKPLTNLIL